MKTLTINLNFLFEEEKKDRLFDKLSKFILKENVKTFVCEDAVITKTNLNSLTSNE